jgi:hypothetical protein
VQDLLEQLHLRKEGFVFLVAAKMHHLFHAQAVVPAPVEKGQFSRDRQVKDITLEIPFLFLPVGGLTQGHHFCLSRTKVFDDAFYSAVLAGGVPPSRITSSFSLEEMISFWSLTSST